jgi:hypothetical protein
MKGYHFSQPGVTECAPNIPEEVTAQNIKLYQVHKCIKLFYLMFLTMNFEILFPLLYTTLFITFCNNFLLQCSGLYFHLYSEHFHCGLFQMSDTELDIKGRTYAEGVQK